MDIPAINAQIAIGQTALTNIYNLVNPPSNIVNVGVNDNLLSLIASNPAGTIFVIDPLFQLSGDIVLNKPLTLQSAAPFTGRPTIATKVPTITGSITATAPSVNLINMGIYGSPNGGTLLSTFDNLLLQSSLLLGSNTGQHRGVLANNTKNAKIVDSYIGQIFNSIDTQAIVAWDGLDGLDVENTYLEASGENVLLGGEDASSAAAMPKNVTINNCDLVKPLSWQGIPTITVKNLFEIKCGINVNLTNSRLKNCWTSGQDGYAILLTVRNQNGAAPFSAIVNILIDSNTIENTTSGIQILGNDYSNPSQFLDTVQFSGNKFTKLNGGRTIFISRGSKNLQFVGDSFDGINLNSALSFDDPTYLNTNFMVSGCEFVEGDYGIFGTGAPALGEPVLAMYAPSYTWKNVTIHKGTSGRTIVYPPGTTVV